MALLPKLETTTGEVFPAAVVEVDKPNEHKGSEQVISFVDVDNVDTFNGFGCILELSSNKHLRKKNLPSLTPKTTLHSRYHYEKYLPRSAEKAITENGGKATFKCVVSDKFNVMFAIKQQCSWAVSILITFV